MQDERGAVVGWEPVDRVAEHAAELALQRLLVHAIGPVGHGLEVAPVVVKRGEHVVHADLA